MNDGDDSILASGRLNSLFGDDGDDTIQVFGDSNRLPGGEGDDLLLASGKGNILTLDGGDDTAIADGGNTIVFSQLENANPDSDVATINVTDADIANNEITRIHGASVNDTININLPDNFDGNVHLIDFVYSYTSDGVTTYTAQQVVVVSDASIDEVVMDLTGASFSINDTTVTGGFQHALLPLSEDYQVIATLDLGGATSNQADPSIAQSFTLNLDQTIASTTTVDLFGVLT